MTASWQHQKMKRADMNADPVEGEFFTPEGLAESLVREAIQNSLDAKAERVVKVRFGIYEGDRAAPAKTAGRYIEHLLPHLEACGVNTGGLLGAPMPYIVVEDFGTRGLTGDTNQHTDTPSTKRDDRNDFFYFWRNVGRSNKGESDRGRWGLGKTVFPAASHLSSFFGVTRRLDDPRLHIMGQSVLKIHTLNGERYHPYGYFAEFESDGFAVPVADESAVGAFCEDFSVVRRRDPGLTIVIPHARVEEIKADDIIRAAVLHYFYPILAGDLIVEIDTSDGIATLEAAKLRGILSLVDWREKGFTEERLGKLFDLAQWAINLPETEYAKALKAGEHGAPRWSPDLLQPEQLAELQEKFGAGEKMAIRVPVTVEIKEKAGKKVVDSFFDVFLQRDEEMEQGDDHYIRRGLAVSRISMIRDKSVRGFVVINDGQLATLLGDAENPAHTDWEERSGKLKDRYERGPSRVSFVKNSLRMLVQYLTRPPNTRDEALLRDIFFIDLPPDEYSSPASGGAQSAAGTEKAPPVDIPHLLSRPRCFALSPIQGGFKITGNPNAPKMPKAVRVRVAYEVRRGNPFKRYTPFDFDVGKRPIRCIATGASITSATENRIEINVQSPNFDVEVKGFDERRDLKIDAKPVGVDE